MSCKTIYATVNGGSDGWWNAIAICECGSALAGHISSTHGWAKHDMGLDNDVMKQHAKYRAHCPDGYKLVWVGSDELRSQIKNKAGVMHDVLLRHKALLAARATDNQQLPTPSP